MVDAAAETDARAAFLYTPMDDLMRDAFGPPDSAEELTPEMWNMPSLVPSEMHDDEWVSLPSTDDDEWVMVPSPRRSRSAAAATTERADLASSMLQLQNIQHRLDALQLEIYWYGVAPLGAKTTARSFWAVLCGRRGLRPSRGGSVPPLGGKRTACSHTTRTECSSTASVLN